MVETARAADSAARPVELARAAARTAAAHADDVDRLARFPSEAMASLRAARLMAALVPTRLGGLGASLSEVAAVCELLGQHCANTAMIFAMHQIQVAGIVRFGCASPFFEEYLRGLAESQWLLASATTEAGVGGDVRTSLCSVDADTATGRFTLVKQAPVISYGDQADDILVTARRTPTSPSSDQVLVLVRRADRTLTVTGGWDTLGFRGTCSLGYLLEARADLSQILPRPYADISAQSMHPVSHLLWSALWLGLATDAANRARASVRAEARRTPGAIPPTSLRLAELMVQVQGFRANVQDCLREYERLSDDADALASMGFALRMNNLKIAASQEVVRIVAQALAICGIAGYRTDTPYALGRHLRDAYGAQLMIHNDRIHGNNAQMLLVHKDA